MRKFFLLIPVLSLTLISCDQSDKRTTTVQTDRERTEREVRDNANRNAPQGRYESRPMSGREYNYNSPRSGSYYNSDNTGVNIRDRDSDAITPMDQSESEEDRRITQQIRKALINDGGLSTNAKNIKIITVERIVTLRGPVATPDEIQTIISKVRNIEGIDDINNQLEPRIR